ncbi:MAG: two-component system response regulator [marine bacterium B5-7]|nr:MAG: two-component system response regulator [marine bacterium B5-7]
MGQVIHKRILIIDDDIDMRQILSLKLKKLGYSVLEAEDGNAGLKKLKSESPDMVMVDVNMPGMDGFEFCEHAAKLKSEKHIPIMVMTAQDDQASIDKAYKKGATDFITKPINYVKLVHRIRFSIRSSETSEKLASRERQLLTAQKIAKMGEWIYDIENMVFHCSDQVANIFNISKQCVMTHDDLINYIVEDDVSRVKAVLDEALITTKNESLEYSIKLDHGVIKRIRQIIDVNANDPIKEGMIFGVFQDVSDLRNAEQQVKTLELYDSLSGLPNRSFFKRILSKKILSYRKYTQQFALLDINFDNFMRINSNLGHDVGDKLIIAACERLKNMLHDHNELIDGQEQELFDTSFLAHLGGDNFIILLSNIKKSDDAAIVARQVITKFSEAFNILNNEIHLSISIGIGLYPDDGNNADDLLKKASSALHYAKETGKNCYRFYTEEMNILSFQRLSMETALRKALEQEQFVLYFQPKISLIDNSITGAEALIRWHHPEMGLVSPAEFIPLAESTGLIGPMTDWVIMDACRQIGEWHKNGFQLESVAINITPTSLLDKCIHEHVLTNLQLAGIQASRLDLEITESILMEDVDVILPILQEFKELGCSISIDDFGTGYSSLSYLKRLPISKLKIDQSFIREIMHDNDDSVIVNAVIALAHSLGLKVIAEGVEDKDQLEYLTQHDCDVVQGYYYSCPLVANDFYQWGMQYQAEVMEKEPIKLLGSL